MSDRFAGIPRGKPLPGARKIAGYMLDDEEQWRSIYSLPREEFGLIDLNGKLTGFTGWIDHAVTSRIGKKRRRRARNAQAEATTGAT
jgi:hypothetical protein